MRIAGTDKQLLRSLSKFPLTLLSTCRLTIGKLVPQHIAGILIYLRLGIELPVRISGIKAQDLCLTIELLDNAGAMPAHATIPKSQGEVTVPIVTTLGLPYGIIRVYPLFYTSLYPIVLYGHSGYFKAPLEFGIIDSSVYIPYNVRGVLCIRMAGNDTITGYALLTLTDNIIACTYEGVLGCQIGISAYSYVPLASNAITLLKVQDTLIPVNLGAHIIIKSTILSDVRVLTLRNNNIILVKACDV